MTKSQYKLIFTNRELLEFSFTDWLENIRSYVTDNYPFNIVEGAD